MDLQDSYDELDNIIKKLDSLIDEITDKNYKEQLRETKYQAENELEEIKVELQKQYDREEKEQENEYWRCAI